MFELKILTHFSAAHQLKMVGEKCENLHGHNWNIEVRVTGGELNRAGVLMDFGELKKHVAEIMATLDHQFLNDLDVFNDEFPPSSENIAIYISTRLREKIIRPDVRVSRVSAWESANSCATYIIDD
ncbi:MAG: 6-carboxytetrahydropterin synthase QueD [Thermodesulfobacteriota bacterium]|nr:6-carboxytetrahydropterin synthase QueD [Thermodesulfobacteriota bacterium]